MSSWALFSYKKHTNICENGDQFNDDEVGVEVADRSESTPFEDKGEGSDGEGGKHVAVDGEYKVVHALLEANGGDYIHACIPKLKGYYGCIGLHFG